MMNIKRYLMRSLKAVSIFKNYIDLKPPKMPKYEIGKHEWLKFFKYYKKLDNLKGKEVHLY